MTARLRGCVQYERAAIGLAIHIITSAIPPADEDQVKHEDEQKSDGANSTKTQSGYPTTSEAEKTT